MKKQKYIILLLSLLIVFLLLFFVVNISFVGAESEKGKSDYLTDCAEKEGWTYNQALSPKTKFYSGEDPVEYYTTFFKIFDCFRNTQTKPQRLIDANEPWSPSSWFSYKAIGSLSRTVKMPWEQTYGNVSQCHSDGSDACGKTDHSCRQSCGNIQKAHGYEKAKSCYLDCRFKNYKCHDEYNIKCENELRSLVMAWAREKKVELDKQIPAEKPKTEKPKADPYQDPEEKICEPNETKCENDYLWRCKSSGLSWESTKCLIGCDSVTSQCIEHGDLSITLSPNKVRLPADGKASQEFSIVAKAGDTPLKGEKFTISIWAPFSKNAISDFGKTNVKTVTTDSSGRASFIYTAPMSPEGIYFKNFNFQIRVIGITDKKIEIILVDPKPIIDINMAERSILEGKEPGVNYIDIGITDEFGKEWDIKIESNLGRLAPQGRSGEFYTLIDKTRGKEYKFNWLPPEGAAELVDAIMNYTIAHQKDWSKFKTGIKEDSVDFALSELFFEKPKAMEEFKSWKDFYENSKVDVKDLQEYVRQIKTSTSAYERFLRSLSMGFRGLQVFHGTKGFVEDKLGDSNEKSSFKEYLEGIRDKTIHYGIDSLKSGLNHWADLVREGSLDTRRIPVTVRVEITNDLGFKARKSGTFEYIYYTLERQ